MMLDGVGSMDEARGADRLGVCVGWLVMLAVVVHATQVSVCVPLGAGKRQLNLSVVDVVLACAFGLWVVRRVARRARISSMRPIAFSSSSLAPWRYKFSRSTSRT